MRHDCPNDFADCTGRTSAHDQTARARLCGHVPLAAGAQGLPGPFVTTPVHNRPAVRDLSSHPGSTFLFACLDESRYIEEGNINMFLFPWSPLIFSCGFTGHWPLWPLHFPNLLWVGVSKRPLQLQALVFRDQFRPLISVKSLWSPGHQGGDRAFL